jgi:hypothetical protein
VIDISPVSPTHINKDQGNSLRDMEKTLDYKKQRIVLNGGIERMELKKLKKQGESNKTPVYNQDYREHDDYQDRSYQDERSIYDHNQDCREHDDYRNRSYHQHETKLSSPIDD